MPCLNTREMNALRLLLDKRIFTIQEIAELDYDRVRCFPGVGTKSLSDICAWLAEHGLQLRNTPAAMPPPKPTEPDPRVKKAIRVLQDEGYLVVPPTRAEAARK